MALRMWMMRDRTRRYGDRIDPTLTALTLLMSTEHVAFCRANFQGRKTVLMMLIVIKNNN